IVGGQPCNEIGGQTDQPAAPGHAVHQSGQKDQRAYNKILCQGNFQTINFLFSFPAGKALSSGRGRESLSYSVFSEQYHYNVPGSKAQGALPPPAKEKSPDFRGFSGKFPCPS